MHSVPEAQTGSMYPLLKHLAGKGDFPWSFLHHRFTSLDSWKHEARAQLLQLLQIPDRTSPPRAIITDIQDFEGYTRETIHLEVWPGISPIPGFLLIPSGSQSRRPAVHLLHDHSAFYAWGKEKVTEQKNEHPSLTTFKRRMYHGASIASDLARRGYVVLVTDAPYWGERRMVLPGDPDHCASPERMTDAQIRDFNQRASARTNQVAAGFAMSGHSWMGVTLAEDLRVMDYLFSRTEVDPARVACLGQSMGGFRATHLVGLDGRYSAAVVSGWMSSYEEMLRDGLHAFSPPMVMPGLYPLMDLPDVASMLAPNPLMAINGTHDQLFTRKGVESAYAKISRVYEKAEAPSQFEGVWYEGPHEFNLEMQKKAFDWLDRALKRS
jgi:dienelactone hydrolase